MFQQEKISLCQELVLQFTQEDHHVIFQLNMLTDTRIKVNIKKNILRDFVLVKFIPGHQCTAKELHMTEGSEDECEEYMDA